MGAKEHDWPNEIQVNIAGNVFVGGQCYYPIDLNPGPEMEVHDDGVAGFLMKLLPDGSW